MAQGSYGPRGPGYATRTPASALAQIGGFNNALLKGNAGPAAAQAALAKLQSNPILGVLGFNQNAFIVQGVSVAGYHVGDVRIEDQTAAPDNPGIRKATSSAYGNVIPLSLGKRRVSGNVIQSTAIVPVLEGTRSYPVTYYIPLYEDPPVPDGGWQISSGEPDRTRPDPDNPPENCGAKGCDDPTFVPSPGTGGGGGGPEPAGDSFVVCASAGGDCCAGLGSATDQELLDNWAVATYATYAEAETRAILEGSGGLSCAYVISMEGSTPIARSECYSG